MHKTDREYIGRRVMRLELERRRFIHAVKENMKMVGVREYDGNDRWRQIVLYGDS